MVQKSQNDQKLQSRAAYLAEMLPPVTLILARRYGRRFKSGMRLFLLKFSLSFLRLHLMELFQHSPARQGEPEARMAKGQVQILTTHGEWSSAVTDVCTSLITTTA